MFMADEGLDGFRQAAELVGGRKDRKTLDTVRGHDFKLARPACLEEHKIARHLFIISWNGRRDETNPLHRAHESDKGDGSVRGSAG
jgi:hypothetical protein